ncbi:hypothetical protein VPNG_07054 [Cytospora leucostoma]|uniref:Methyltransferase type 11 domain-containing protein n=1 Tax=Cytospora leucostoma TaxID=1230097 RepID=A0A423WVB2_9PEZI|nr:hypothetical protein VPNG_07054 [Cytospora leucostoma]
MSNQAGPEKTFRSYTSEQGKNYARHRMRYSQVLYEDIISHHTSTGGKRGTVLDVGCGPGIATFALAQFFDNAIGLDPSEGMISTARSLLATEQPKPNVKFDISTAEDIDPTVIPDSSVDLITAATCAHWFDMPRFWPTAARVLRPGGTFAMWNSNAAYLHHSVPNAAAINAAVKEIEEEELLPFFEPGNLLTRSLYSNIGLPWTVEPRVPDFDESALFRNEWGTEDNDVSFYEGAQVTLDLDTLEKMLGTSSPVTRWREAHPGAVGTEKDVIRRIRRVVETLLHEAGVEKGKELVRGGEGGVLIMVKRV